MKVQIWYQPAISDTSVLVHRFRFISENEYSWFEAEGLVSNYFGYTCCWDLKQNDTIKKKIKAMHQYDKNMGFKKAIYMGSI